jgi:glycosyltransferase involved in cell wall biosynthesis
MNAGSREISVALCTYNGEKFLPEQLDSIAAQTVFPNELVVSDDGSSDATLSILHNFASSAPFAVRILQTQSNLGSTKNFEYAIAHCTGAIVALSDQDDVWRPEKLEKLREALNANSDAGFVVSDSELIDQAGKSLHATAWQWHRFDWASYNSETARQQFRRLIAGSFVTGATMAFRSRLFPTLRPFSVEWYHDAWIAIVANAFGWRGVALSEPLIEYRQHQAQQIGGRPRVDVIGSAKRWLFKQTRSRDELAKACETRAKGLDHLIDKLENPSSNDSADSELIPLVRLATDHERQRCEIFRSAFRRRVKLVARELLSGNYQSFSGSGWRAFRDLFL